MESSSSGGAVAEHSRRRIAYYYDANIGNYYYGVEHVMKPNRIRMAHHLILNYGMYRHLGIFRPFPATVEEMSRFHNPGYLEFLKKATPDNLNRLGGGMLKYNVGEDCPVFDGLFEFCQLSSGGSLAAAIKLNKKRADIAINWMGGLHHAKKGEASGFCYTNDIVLGILELLKYHKRVLYVDIDVHHGDGVEEAFYTTDRVMTVSFHKFGDFFPGTGDIKTTGHGIGKNFSVNVPLKSDINDQSYQSIFKPVMQRVIERFEPAAIVLQCGADSLNGDPLGRFNMTLKGHGECVRFLRSFNIPMMLLGGGGYSPNNVARCWAYETAIACNVELSNDIPSNDFMEFFGPNYKLHIEARKVENKNSQSYLNKMKQEIFENLNDLTFVPSVQMRPIPEDAFQSFNDPTLTVDMANPDIRHAPQIMDNVVAHPGEFYDAQNTAGMFRHEENYALKFPYPDHQYGF
ncbi:hypothetical protein GCK72_025252 [Caenorhabditis remanei]|uniref:Histone deacetylase n=1 Tax=Caenorhabditis remanei TaxID=31234 RepID=E3MUH8_CAERE|nr:hypothetical protein GCK72_025252 [Caenorhabditis remanei]EFP09707.1 hypothetical protein CRE_21947 [Caenorhabditis remanei]KAF1748785.1 hypothetical protein GCK72_025252 [Caenorhabditis remanei]